jgi:restriction system protein
MEIVYHYPPELFQLLVDGIPLLCRSKGDTLTFLRGAGVDRGHLAPLEQIVANDPKSITKYEIVRRVLGALNDKGESALRERREILRRVVEFEEFSTCWPDDQLKARGIVAEIQRVINVKDSFTRMKNEKDRESALRRAEIEEKQRALRDRCAKQDEIRRELGMLVASKNPQARGRRFEQIVNEMFESEGILVRESFAITAEKGPGVIEQIDGVIEIDGELYFVEIKWLASNVGVEDVSRHLVRIYHRHSGRGLFVSVTPFTEAALQTCQDALQHKVVTLSLLEEILEVLEEHGNLRAFLKAKVQAAVIDRKPFVRVRPRRGAPGPA